MERRIDARWRAFLAAWLMLVLLATAVFAHEAVMTKSEPANGELLAESPPEVRAWFAEELVSGESTISVFNSQGVQVDNEDGGVDLNDPDHASLIVTLPPLADGSYTVQWHVVLLDGDATDGAFAFGVGKNVTVNPASAPEPAAEAPDEGGPTTGVIAAVVGGLVVLALVGGLALRRRQA
ncbi:MAG: hypothetical protein GY803_15835 [Chloroflexi bacterium]|nr:hypothetical protein [Chloroflexota bacterium]